SLDQLSNSEKTFVGSRIEYLLRKFLAVPRGPLDLLIGSEAVDVKFTLGRDWMIPPEAGNRICLLIMGSDRTSKFSCGIVRIRQDILRGGKNRDSKASISADGRKAIVWLVDGGAIPPNQLEKLPTHIVE